MKQTAILKRDIIVPDGGYWYQMTDRKDYVCPKGTEVEIYDPRTFYEYGNEVIEVLYPNGMTKMTQINSLKINKNIKLDRSLYLYALEDKDTDDVVYQEDGKIAATIIKPVSPTIDWGWRKWDLFIKTLDNCIELYGDENKARAAAYDTANRIINFYKEEENKSINTL